MGPRGPCYFLDRVGITPRALFESWSQAQRGPSFGEPISWRERAKFMSLSNWGTMVGHVRRSVSEVQKAHRASQKLATILIDAIGELGDGPGDGPGDAGDFASVAPHYAKLIEAARDDEAFRILCNPLKTESLRAVFPDDGMDRSSFNHQVNRFQCGERAVAFGDAAHLDGGRDGVHA